MQGKTPIILDQNGNALNKVSNYMFPTPDHPIVGRAPNWKDDKGAKHNLNYYISPIQFARVKIDIQYWRDAISEAEAAYYPFRVRMQRVYQDTVLNGHVQACILRRMNMTLLRGFKMCNDKGEQDDDYTNFFDKKWFYEFLNYALEAKFFGYSLIHLGNIVDNEFPEITVIRRQNISPDRLNVANIVQSVSGAEFLKDPWKDWYVWVPTPTDIGVSLCGYGLLYKVALYEIICRNLLGFNADAAELFGMPIRVGKTSKTDSLERATFQNALANMGSAGYILMDMMDEIELVEKKTGGKGQDIFENLEKRCEDKISKVILGHADALDSVPGRLGATQGKDSAVAQALRDIQVSDGRFVEYVVNKELIPKMRNLGILIPDNLRFEFKNDAEMEDMRRLEDESNQATANIMKTIKDAGGKANWKYFEERTGIEVEEAPEPEPMQPFGQKPNLTEKIKNRLDEIYK